ncbi:fasciclin domain protein [Asticcacaulis biprosthecium C19]|uniref:Fasciclin domain protein n=1 Tax=Asticcacaulis biprosthecium C19 TaxID=715226 RepID=F4QPY8_9CAUL|nr:fasciclin domain-containing protein [Asticcacaulis biprosthecium]EGF90275.1 fasciclin domain protein [Asticcacaulis biprosthecium C19]
MTNRNVLRTMTAALMFGACALSMPAMAGSHNDGGHAMAKTTIVEAAAANPDFSTLVAAVKAAGLVETLSSDGPFTVFAPTNAAFAALPAGTVDTLLKPENKATLTKVLTYHVVAGKVKAADLIAAIHAHGGSYAFKTVSGDTLTATLVHGSVKLTDESGGVATVTATDLKQKNGIIHVIDKVVLPK